MTSSRPPSELPVDAGPRLRPSDERARVAADGRTTRRIALVALVLGLVGTGLVVARLLAPGAASCQDDAWAVRPDSGELPSGWSVSARQYDVNRQQVTIVGAAPADETTTQAVVYVTITCFPEGAADAVSRSETAARDAGQTVTSRTDLGDGGFAAIDSGGSTFLQLRHASVVVYMAASGDATPSEVDLLASAYDKALGGDGGAVAIGTPDIPSDSAPSAEDSAAPSDEVPSEAAAPALEALLPTTVNEIALTVDSASGTDVLAQDQSSRAISAALRAEGKEPTDMLVAQAFDDTQQADLSILAVSVAGLAEDKVRTIMLDTWLAASGAGVTRDTVTLDGKKWTRVDYGDKGSKDYVLAERGHVIVITTASPELAAAAAVALP
ncbi:MAG: hypothetical protein ABIR11_13435 [Candidatus Limnocylindrales bacterium]